MRLFLSVLTVSLLVGGPSFAKDTRFWNLTKDKIVSFQLSAPGKDAWGPDQTVNDPDHSVDPDERLKITATPPRLYDAKFADARGRTCIVPNITIVTGEIFSISEAQVSKCAP